MRFVSNLRAPPHNAHYEGDYSEEAMRWRRVCGADKAENLTSILGNEPVETVLEVGCGTGCVLAELRKKGIGSTHIGVDLADPAAHRDENAHGLTLLNYDGVRLPFDDDSFDLVYASHVLEHVPDERAFVRELARVSRKYVYLEVPCELTLRTSESTLQHTLNIGHINSYTPLSFVLTLETTDAEPIRMEIFSHSNPVALFYASSSLARIKAWTKEALRRAMLRGPWKSLAPSIFVYHCGALCRPRNVPPEQA